MKKKYCDLCKKRVRDTREANVRIALPTPGVIDDPHTFEPVEVCEDCARKIELAVAMAEIDMVSIIRMTVRPKDLEAYEFNEMDEEGEDVEDA